MNSYYETLNISLMVSARRENPGNYLFYGELLADIAARIDRTLSKW